MPAQSGNTAVLERMRRGYSREAYLDLIAHVKEMIPGVSLSSDFICGFCGETDSEFQDTLSLMAQVKYNMAYLFAYSMREVSIILDLTSDDHSHPQYSIKLLSENKHNLCLGRFTLSDFKRKI